MRYAYMSDKGLTRENNEDFILISENLSLFLLADGMGGHSAGEIASEEACNFIVRYVNENASELEDRVVEVLVDAIKAANTHVLNCAESKEELKGMGTTLVLLYYRDSAYTILNVGDSRAYKYVDGKLLPLSRDHSLVQEMLDDGIINETEAKNHAYRNVVTQSLGMPMKVEPQVIEGVLQEGETLLLCTDGLHDYVDMNEVAEFLSGGDLDFAVKKAIDLANKSGGNDNCSLICVGF